MRPRQPSVLCHAYPELRNAGSPRPRNHSGRRDVGQHIQEVFSGLPPGTALTIREIAAVASSQYSPGEISHGAIAALLDRGDPLPGLEEVSGSRPRSIRRRGPVVAPDGAASTGHTSGSLSRGFHQEMVRLYQRSQGEVGYNPTAFIGMISEHGGVETARRLVMSPNPSDGFTTLWEARRLDLTAEALVVRLRFAPLFGDEVVDRCAPSHG